MIRRTMFLLCTMTVLAAGCAAEHAAPPARTEPAPIPTATQPASTQPTPPTVQRRPFSVLSPNGTRQDDYYWLRDDSRTSADVLDYLHRENAYRDAMMAPTVALQRKLYDELAAREQPDDASVPVFEHGYWYYRRFEPGLEYPVYARRKDSMSGPEQVMLNGNALSKGHDFFQIGSAKVSPNGKLVAYTEDTVGRRQYTLKIKDLETGLTLHDAVRNVEPDMEWSADNSTLLYIEKDPVTLLSIKTRKHKLGSHSPQDPVVYEEKDHTYYMNLVKSRSEKYLFIYLHSTQQDEWWYADAADPQLRFKAVLAREANLKYNVESFGKDFIVQTNWQAPNYRIVRAPVARSADKRTWRDIVPHSPDVFIEGYEVSEHYLAVDERSGGVRKLRLKPWAGGKDSLVEPDDPAGAIKLIATPDLSSTKLRYEFTSLISPTMTYDLDLRTGTKELKKTQMVRGYDKADYRTEFLFATARDGTRVPVSVAYRAGTPINGTAPLYQYAYGSYGDSLDPDFEGDWVSLMDRGFVVAIAHIRGGQELGRQWYEDGRQLHKKNTFTDFIDVTRYLVQKGYAAKDKTFAAGASAGGLLMGAVANMAPRDYRGIIAYVPFVDAVTTMLDDSIPLTSNEFDEWGNPQKKDFYDYMLSYSPYDNVSAQNYPAMLVFTSLWDSQVQYYEPTKWVAKLRATKTDNNPLVFTIDTAAGHGGKSGRFQPFHDTALEYAFILNQLKM